MSDLKMKLTTNWHAMRILRLGIGLLLVASAVQSKDWVMGMFGAFFLYQGIADVGCCGAAGCAPRTGKNTESVQATDMVDYEEVK